MGKERGRAVRDGQGKREARKGNRIGRPGGEKGV